MYFTNVHLDFCLRQHSENFLPTYFTYITTFSLTSANDAKCVSLLLVLPEELMT